ncbi:ubiquitin-like-conjugating enzyme ATG10 [Stomoxys calcitrans]|uniref:ubiquitin-like-conjugating enzyme ATG10 n=1 Tax=Stomoxys calcitrans TaxID=35570 RepID=UPI0027E38A7E|nr:ubiquitin-like-conjugating enzyme ATG10 [Stomoxys calcitrans]
MAACETLLTWPEFCKESKEFILLSEKLDDTWSWEEKNSNIGQSYLKYQQKISVSTTNDLLQIEYHIVYSVSYQVPIMYFQAHYSDGKMIKLDDAWQIFHSNRNSQYSREDMLGILTQMEHPILFKPYMCLHPCRTAEILAQTPLSKNRLLTFVSVMGPYLQLNLDNRYGMLYI